jgi:hypothetical protein
MHTNYPQVSENKLNGLGQYVPADNLKNGVHVDFLTLHEWLDVLVQQCVKSSMYGVSPTL